MYARHWPSSPKFNMKLITTRKMKRLRICVLVSARPSGSMPPLFTLFSALARKASERMFWTWGNLSRVAASGPRISLTPVTLAAGMLPLSMFHNVRPVTRSISPSMTLESCALNAGLPIGFSVVIIQAGVALPLPPLALPLLPRPGHLGSVVARMLHPPAGTLQYTDVDLTVSNVSFFEG